jgi:hypothetical protein
MELVTPVSVPAIDPSLTAFVVRARASCIDIDKPLVAFNWYTLDGWAGQWHDLRYKAYAVPRVLRYAKPHGVVLFASDPTVVARRTPSASARIDEGTPMPWVHDVVTMPFYPNPLALIGMVASHGEEYLHMAQIKERAIGRSGYFSFQECLFDCENLYRVEPEDLEGGIRAALRTFFDRKIQGRILVLHATIDGDRIPAAVAMLSEAHPPSRADASLRYVGRTVADVFSRFADGSERTFFQRPHWMDLTVILSLSPEADASSLVAEPVFAEFLRTAREFVVLEYAP